MAEKINKIEINNLLEEIQDNLQECIKCGNCKALCPVFRIIREEHHSPRGHVILLSNKIVEKLVWECCLCKACEERCPFNLKICKSIKKARQVLNLKGKELQENKEIINRIKKTGYVYEDKEEDLKKEE